MKAQVLAAIRELEMARAILRGQPLNAADGADDLKKSRAGRA
jgi:hypothetical protein